MYQIVWVPATERLRMDDQRLVKLKMPLKPVDAELINQKVRGRANWRKFTERWRTAAIMDPLVSS